MILPALAGIILITVQIYSLSFTEQLVSLLRALRAFLWSEFSADKRPPGFPPAGEEVAVEEQKMRAYLASDTPSNL